jgi:hypothetical protein
VRQIEQEAQEAWSVSVRHPVRSSPEQASTSQAELYPHPVASIDPSDAQIPLWSSKSDGKYRAVPEFARIASLPPNREKELLSINLYGIHKSA